MNVIESVVNYGYKMGGVRIFGGFLGERWSIDTLFYFLVMRGLLEQVTGDRILDKVHQGQGKELQNVLGYKLRMNPQEKAVSE